MEHYFKHDSWPYEYDKKITIENTCRQTCKKELTYLMLIPPIDSDHKQYIQVRHPWFVGTMINLAHVISVDFQRLIQHRHLLLCYIHLAKVRSGVAMNVLEKKNKGRRKVKKMKLRWNVCNVSDEVMLQVANAFP